MLWFRVFSQLSIGIIIILSAGGAGLYFITKYDNGKSIEDEISNLEKQESDIKKEIETLNIELKNLSDMDKTMNVMGSEINKFLQFIPNKMTSSMILNHLNNQAKVAGVNLLDIVTHSNTEKKEFYEKLKVSVTMKGLFTQILVFLAKLTSLTEIITVERFRMDSVTQKKKIRGLTEVKIQMDIYGYRYTSSIIEEKKEN